jgi:pimeloyl-ACP methyl ester carboxylesterase
MKLELISRLSDEKTHAPPLLFVHGAWHAAWCWQEYFIPYFAARGWDCYAFSLRGHGGSEGHVRWASGADYVADVEQIIEQIGKRPVIIAHSMGGYVLQKYLETHTIPAAVLMASIPSRGTLGLLLRSMRHRPLSVLETLLTLDLYPMVGTPERAHELLFSPAMSRRKVEIYFRKLQSESYRILLDSAFFDVPRPRRRQTPLLVLGSADDAVFTVDELKATASDYRTLPMIFNNIAHDMMLDARWREVADCINNWLKAQRL